MTSLNWNGEAIRNDLDECVKDHLLFKSGIMKFDSPRTKVYDRSDVSNFSTWLVDKNLTDEEKIKIGLLAPANRVSENEFINELENVNCEIETFINSKSTTIRNVKYASVPLDELFRFPEIKSGLTEKLIRSNTGSVPVYGGRQTETPVGMVADNLNGAKRRVKKIKKLRINIPVDANGGYDIEMQRKIYIRLEKYDAIKANLKKKIEDIVSMQLDF